MWAVLGRFRVDFASLAGLSALFTMARSRSPRHFSELSATKARADGLETWVALSPEQVACLPSGAQPDGYSKRFGLRRSPAEALERATEFMGWRPQGQSRSERRERWRKRSENAVG